jgi:hypothetical protein
LENAVSKRAFFRWGENDENMDDTDSDVDGPSSSSNADYRRAPAQLSETLLERYRRQSAPTNNTMPMPAHVVENNVVADQQPFAYTNNFANGASPLNHGVVQPS